MNLFPVKIDQKITNMSGELLGQRSVVESLVATLLCNLRPDKRQRNSLQKGCGDLLNVVGVRPNPYFCLRQRVSQGTILRDRKNGSPGCHILIKLRRNLEVMPALKNQEHIRFPKGFLGLLATDVGPEFDTPAPK